MGDWWGNSNYVNLFWVHLIEIYKIKMEVLHDGTRWVK